MRAQRTPPFAAATTKQSTTMGHSFGEILVDVRNPLRQLQDLDAVVQAIVQAAGIFPSTISCRD
jgi:hypothetical protein